MQSAAIRSEAPSSTVRIARIDAFSINIIIFFLCFWHWRTTGSLDIQTLGVLSLFVALSLAYGRLFVIAASRLLSTSLGLPFQVLTGYFVFNSLLFILTLCSPFGMVNNVIALSLLGGAGFLIKQKSSAGLSASHGSRVAAMTAILITGIGATIWCGDVQTPIRLQDSDVLFRVWPDVFIHAREISVFSQAHGITTIQDIKLAGSSAPIYHFASYVSPSAISAMTGASAMSVFASFHLPFGIFLTGLAAFCLVSLMFSYWAGVAAVVALILVPDAYHQGFGNRYLSYNFLAQVNLGLLYGIACATIAWLFVLEGCRKGKICAIIAGYAFLVVCLFYKAHIFVANSYLLLIFPLIFFTRLSLYYRVFILAAATALFVGVVTFSQSNPRIPVMRLDGSGIGRYIVMLFWYYEEGFIKAFFEKILIHEVHAKLVQAVWTITMLLISTFGAWIFALPLALIGARNRIPTAFLWFPILVVLNYLVMTIGLAIDSRGVGTPDELLNRPLVWAYFVAVVWTSGAAYTMLVGSKIPDGKIANIFLIAGTLTALIITVRQAPNLQTFPNLSTRSSFSKWAVPSCLVRSAEYIRLHSHSTEIIQDSTNDPNFVLTALSERQLYVGEVSFGGANSVQEARLLEMEHLKNITDLTELQHFASERGISFYLIDPGTTVSWPRAFVDAPEFSCGAYKLYRFIPPT